MELKKLFSSLALSSFAFFGMAQAADLEFTDAAEIPSWANEAISELMDQGVLAGNDDGSFAPNRQLNRAEVSKIIVLATGVESDTTGGPHFPDVAEDAWYYDYIETMYNQGWINGYPDGQFRPGVGINRAELAKMTVNGFKLDQDLSGAPHFDDVASGDWFYGYVETIYNAGAMKGYGDGTFGAGNAVTRAETAKIVYDAQLVALGSFNGVAEGTLEVSLSDKTPRGTNIPYNATSVPFTTLELTAADDADIEITSLTFTRLGLGDNDDFDNVWLEIDGFKVGNDKSVNNDDVVELRFNPPVVVPAGQTLTADLVASMKYTTSGENSDKNIGHHNRFVLVAADDMVSSAANVAGDFPIEGEEMEVADYQVTQLTFANLGSDATVNVGDSFVEVGKFKLENQSTTNKDVEVRALTFKNDGTAQIEDVLENAALYVSGEQISAETIIDGDYITFRLDNGVTGGYIIEDGDSRIVSLRADIVSAEKNDTLEFKVDNFEDIVGVEIGTAFGVKAVSTTFNETGSGNGTGTCAADSNAEDNCARLAYYSIKSGDINIARDPSSLSNQQYAPGSNDVVFLTARLVVDQPVIVDGVKLRVAEGTVDGGVVGGAAGITVDTDMDNDGSVADASDEDNQVDTLVTALNLSTDNYRLYLNDKLIDSTNTFTTATESDTATGRTKDAILNFNTTFEISGTSILKLVGNIDSTNAVAGDKFKLKLTNVDFDSPEYISTGDQIATTGIVGSAVGSFVEVKESILTVSKSDGFATTGETIVAGVNDVTLMKFVLDNNNSGDVNVTSASFKAVGADAGLTYQNFTAAIFVDGVQQGSSRALNTDGTVTFSDINVVVASASQKEVELVVDTIEASSNGTGAADTIQFKITGVDADNVENGSTVKVKNAAGTEISSAVTIDGSTFTLVQAGTLTIEEDSTVYSSILLANQGGVETYKIRFKAANDGVEVKDLYLQNGLTQKANGTAAATEAEDLAGQSAGETAGGDRVSFKLYNEAGALVATQQMTGAKLHFQLGNTNRIKVPKDGITTVTIKADVKDITDVSQTGKKLTLKLDTTAGTDNKGVQAVTASTGSDLTTATISGEIKSENFLITKSKLAIKHATTQPAFSDPTLALQEVYRFTVTADAMGSSATIARVFFNLSLSGIEGVATIADGDLTLKQVKSDGSIDNTATILDTTFDVDGVKVGPTSGGTPASKTVAGVQFGLKNQTLNAGESRTYAVFLANTVDNVGAKSDDDSVSFTIITDEVADVAAPGVIGALTTPKVAWADESDKTASSDFFNGYLLNVDSTSKINAD